MGDLGLNEHHQKQLVDFLRFCRYQRNERLRSVTACFDDTRKSRLNDTTYTRDEVVSLLNDLREACGAELTNELLNSAHTSLLLMRQVCAQAELWHLKLNMNLSELENRELLDAVGSFEDMTLNEANRLKERPQVTSILKRLEPMELSTGVAPLLQTEIERLRHENEQLRKRVGQSEQAVNQSVNQKMALQEQLEKEHSARNKAFVEDTQPTGNNSSVDDGKLDELQSQLQLMNAKLSHKTEQQQQLKDDMQQQLVDAHKRLLQVKEQLSMTETELDKKFSATQAYKNMKLMLMQKNKQLRDVRRKLDKYEPSAGEDDEVVEEDD